MSFEEDAEATAVIDSRGGIQSNWWRTVGTISPVECRERLTAGNLDIHINDFDRIDPISGEQFGTMSPFISLSCGTVERNEVAQFNTVAPAMETALWFGSRFYERRTAYLYPCWVILAPRPSVDVESVAEEVRDLHSYRAYSRYHAEGEVLAKVIVPENQILRCEKWELSQMGEFELVWTHVNPSFTPPERLTNVRELI